MIPWDELSERDRVMITAAKLKATVLVAMPADTAKGLPAGIAHAKLVAWRPRTNQPVARVRFGTGTCRTVPHHAITLAGPAPEPVQPVHYAEQPVWR